MSTETCDEQETVAGEKRELAGKPDNGTSEAKRKYTGPASMEFKPVEPWPEPVDGGELLDALVKKLKRFVVFSKWTAETFALWILHTYAFRLREVTTYIGIESPEKECGKSTLITVLSEFVDRAAVSSNISSSAFFRAIEELQPTLLIDEADTNLRGKDDLAGILNSGYTKRTAFVWRMCYDGAPGNGGEGSDGTGAAITAGRVARYSCWCPKAIAGIGSLHPTLASRCIVVRMERKTAREECERLTRVDGQELKRKCARFVADHGEEIAKAEPQMPVGLTNRAADIWEPMLALADLAGGRWPGLAREAAVGLTTRAHEHSPIGALLLDILWAFTSGDVDRILSRELVLELMRRGERPWGEQLKGKPATGLWLAKQLGPYGIKSRTMRVGSELGKGYRMEDFAETFKRYISKSAAEEFKLELAEWSAELAENNGLKKDGRETEPDFGSGMGI